MEVLLKVLSVMTINSYFEYQVVFESGSGLSVNWFRLVKLVSGSSEQMEINKSPILNEI